MVQQSGYGVTTEGRGFQKRIDKLTRLRYDLLTENKHLREMLLRYESTLERYKLALRDAKKLREQRG